jgi:hypothetical protein
MVSMGLPAKPFSSRASTSPMPKAPTITTRNSMPSASTGEPKVNR